MNRTKPQRESDPTLAYRARMEELDRTSATSRTFSLLAIYKGYRRSASLNRSCQATVSQQVLENPGPVNFTPVRNTYTEVVWSVYSMRLRHELMFHCPQQHLTLLGPIVGMF
jgi:hypothetical protein